MHDGERIKSRAQIVDDDAGAFRKPFQPPDGKRFQNIEDTKEYKAGEKRFPGERYGDEGDELTGDLVDDDELRVFDAGAARYARGGGDADERDERGRDDGGPDSACGRDCETCDVPEDYCGYRRPCAGAGLCAADTEESGDYAGPEWGAGAGRPRNRRRVAGATVGRSGGRDGLCVFFFQITARLLRVCLPGFLLRYRLRATRLHIGRWPTCRGRWSGSGRYRKGSQARRTLPASCRSGNGA